MDEARQTEGWQVGCAHGNAPHQMYIRSILGSAGVMKSPDMSPNGLFNKLR